MSKFIKSFVRGMGQAIDLGGTMAPQHGKGGSAADEQALREDWARVGRDMHKATRLIGEKIKASETKHSDKAINVR